MKRGMECSRRRRVSRKRSGQMLLMFFFFLLAFLPLMALIVDLSLVRIARREMQTAVNAAALEGLRGKGLPQGYDKLQRRENSSRLWIRMPDEAANRLEDCPYADDRFCFTLGFLNPLQLNLNNMPHGDLVAGVYNPGTRDHREGVNPQHADYPFDREDFIPFPNEMETVTNDEAFLARRRRTHRPETEAGVSSQELPVPVFFGHFWPPIEGVREHGVTVRAAAIAAARPAMMVWPAFYDRPELSGIIGAVPFAIELTVWTSLIKDEFQTLSLDEIYWLDRDDAPWAVGQSPLLGSQQSLPPNIYYLPIIATIESTTSDIDVRLIVGFGGIEVDTSNQMIGEIDVKRLNRFVAPHNAAAVSQQTWHVRLLKLLSLLPEFQNLSSDDQQEVVQQLFSAFEAASNTVQSADHLLAPALVRSLD